MKGKIALFAAALVILGFSFAIWQSYQSGRGIKWEKKPVVNVVSYPSFVSSFGPGPKLKKQFEKQCDCEVKLVDAGESALMLEKLALRDNMFQADVVAGLDQFLLAKARKKLGWKNIDVATDKMVPVARRHRTVQFVPMDWAPMTFIYRRGETTPPRSLKELYASEYRNTLSLPDPRASTPGKQFLYWFLQARGWNKALKELPQLKKSVHTVASSWSSSYGLFKKKQVSLTFSYLTSAVFHWRVEDNERYQAVTLKKGHPYQVEFFGVPKSCNNCALAKKFAQFLLTPAAQKIIMQNNFMLPVVSNVKEGTLFEKLPDVALISYKQQKTFLENESKWLDAWVKAFR